MLVVIAWILINIFIQICRKLNFTSITSLFGEINRSYISFQLKFFAPLFEENVLTKSIYIEAPKKEDIFGNFRSLDGLVIACVGGCVETLLSVTSFDWLCRRNDLFIAEIALDLESLGLI